MDGQLNDAHIDKLDKYYTKKEVSKLCIDIFEGVCSIDKINDIFVEPSAGSGSFSNIMYERYKNVFAYDILPDHESITKHNFLNLNIPKEWMSKNVHVIGNPPYGKQSSMARKFIKFCSIFSNTIGFILPNSFKKEYMQTSFPPNFHLINQMSIQYNAFKTPNGSPFNAYCSFQIWIKDDNILHRKYIKHKPKYFKFVNKYDNPTFSIQRVGSNAGILSNNTIEKIKIHIFLLNYTMI